mmetsp:Transcript_9710/g.28124  ORF Transcript_9710/g.28124 Transcript_9710/m.28124 type:complete len:122 (-) Transcript_9710:46-411(-)
MGLCARIGVGAPISMLLLFARQANLPSACYNTLRESGKRCSVAMMSGHGRRRCTLAPLLASYRLHQALVAVILHAFSAAIAIAQHRSTSCPPRFVCANQGHVLRLRTPTTLVSYNLHAAYD